MARIYIVLSACAALLGLVSAATAQFRDEDRENLISIYMITISQELCGFAISDNEAGALGIASDKLEATLEMDEQAAQKLYDQISQTMTAQKASGLCDPKGEGARTYKENLAKFAK